MLVKFRISEFVLGVLLTIAVFELGYVFASSQPSQPVEHQQTAGEGNTANSKGEISESFWQRTISEPTAFFTLWVAAFTFILGAATIGLLRATNRSAQIAERALTGLERPVAYVDFPEPGLAILLSMMLGPSGQLHLRITNYGRFPADILNIRPFIKIFDRGGFPEPVIPVANEPRNMPPTTG
jgi:hypothetical protein